MHPNPQCSFTPCMLSNMTCCLSRIWALIIARFTLGSSLTKLGHGSAVQATHIISKMYLVSLELQCNVSPLYHIFGAPSSPSAFSDSPSMLCKSKHSRTAQQQCQSTCAGAFGTLPMSMPSPEGSDIYVLDNKLEASTIYINSSDDSKHNNEVEMVEASVEALQHLYSVFLPPHLHLEANMQDKHCKIANRLPMYTGESWMTAWRRNTAQMNTAKGCASLDGFVVQKVSSWHLKHVQSFSFDRRDTVAPHRST
jgi:hypothetical protein